MPLLQLNPDLKIPPRRLRRYYNARPVVGEKNPDSVTSRLPSNCNPKFTSQLQETLNSYHPRGDPVALFSLAATTLSSLSFSAITAIYSHGQIHLKERRFSRFRCGKPTGEEKYPRFSTVRSSFFGQRAARMTYIKSDGRRLRTRGVDMGNEREEDV